MDAISFVLAIPIKNLRSTNLRELVFRNESQHFVARTCSVSMFYVTDESDQNVEAGEEIEFYRQVKENGQSQYKINGKAYRYEDYLSKLADCNILVKCRNFVVYQGDVQNIAARSPEDLAHLFEDLSGSADMKQQYDELRAERDRLRNIMDMNLKKKYTMISEKKLVQEQKREADEFQEKQMTLRDLRVEYFLWQLQYLQSNLEAQQAREVQLNRERELCERNEEVGGGERAEWAVESAGDEGGEPTQHGAAARGAEERGGEAAANQRGDPAEAAGEREADGPDSSQ